MTAERATTTQAVQIGVESTPGDGAAANKQLLGTYINPTIKPNLNIYSPQGTKHDTTVALGLEGIEASIEGVGSYTDIVYLLSGLVSYAAPVQQGGTAAYLWTHTMANAAADTVKTYCVEVGDAVRAHKFAYGQITGLNLSIDPKACKVSGKMVGRALSDGITMTATPTQRDLIPMLPGSWDIYLDTSSAGLGGTKLTRVLSASMDIADKYKPVYAVNSAIDGLSAVVESKPTITFKLKVEADAAGMGMLTMLRATTKKWLRMESVGALISGSYYYKMTIDACVETAEPSAFQDQDGIYAIEWTMRAVYDATWTKAITIAVINELTAL